MKKILQAVFPLLVVAGISTATLSMPAYAQPATEIKKGVTAAGNDNTSIETRIQTVVNVLLFILGAIAVIMIIIGGIKYTTSNGDSSAVTSAKNTILYSVVGLVVAILAYAIVNFVLNAFK